jgi:undecaprenyl-diphosphatase
MDLLHIIVLAIIQGVTEFLPISSSGHLILPKEILQWPEQGLVFDVAVHVGTLTAVLAYFRKEIIDIVVSWLSSFGRVELTLHQKQNSQLGWCLIIATLPAGLVGLLFDNFIETYLRTTLVVAITMIMFGLLLGFADRQAHKKTYDLTNITITFAVLIGCAQALALIPGISRSGITITVALLCGFSRDSAARFSFLLSVPIIFLSGGYKTIQLLDMPDVNWGDLLLGMVLSAITGFICIRYFLKFINRIGLMPFVIYRLVLGSFLLYWALM